MALLSVTELLHDLRQHDLLEPSQWSLLEHQLQGRFRDAKSLGGEMVRRGWLTDFQLDQLHQGNGELLTLGHYRILDWLGEGGVSQVMKALHIPLHCVCALKILRPSLQDDSEAMRQFHFEVRVMSRLSHPNIVSAVDADPVNQPCWYSMEYVEGTDLDRVVADGGPLPFVQACDYIRQAARGLQHAYERGVVHRDIKPANLLLAELQGDSAQGLGNIKILDMGLARLEWHGKGSYTGTPSQTANIVMGTPDFVAPEQATRPKEADIRADIYSLGCSLYYLLAGQPPFPVRSIAQKLVCHQQAEPAPIESLAKDVAPQFPAVLRKMMAKSPDDRYRTPASVVAALGPFCRAAATPALSR